MSEYITGRVRLSDCATSKAIQGLKTSDKSKELTFVLEGNDNEIVVDSVPPVSFEQFTVRSQGLRFLILPCLVTIYLPF